MKIRVCDLMKIVINDNLDKIILSDVDRRILVEGDTMSPDNMIYISKRTDIVLGFFVEDNMMFILI